MSPTQRPAPPGLQDRRQVAPFAAASSETAICEALTGEIADRCQAQRVLLVLDDGHASRVAACRLPAGEDGAALLAAIGPWLSEARRTGKARLRHGPGQVDPGDQRSCLVAPMRRGNEHVGAVYADVEGRLGRFGDAEREALAALARQGGAALARSRAADESLHPPRSVGERLEPGDTDDARLLDQAQRLLKEDGQRSAELSIVAGVQQRLAANLGLEAIVEPVGEQLRELFGTGSIVIAWFDPDSMQVRPVYVCENGVRLAGIAPFTATPTEAHDRMMRERAVVVDRIDPGSRNVLPGTKLPRSYMRAPVVAGDRVIGIVNVDDFERADAFGDADVRLLGTVAGALGVALQTARLRDEIRRLTRENERRTAELAAIHEIQQGMAEELTSAAIARVVGDKLVEVLGAADLSIWWWDEASDQIRLGYSFSHGRQNLPGIAYPVAALGPPGLLVLVERKSFVAGNWAEQEAMGVTCIPGVPRNLTVASAPIIGGGRVLGLLIAEDAQREHAFDKPALHLLEIVGASMGVALENARLLVDHSPGAGPAHGNENRNVVPGP